MTQRITPGQIKKNNRQQIYNYIYEEKNVSQQAIAYALHLSRPTVATNLSELEEDGLICKNGQLESDQIGRKAVAVHLPMPRAAPVTKPFLPSSLIFSMIPMIRPPCLC